MPTGVQTFQRLNLLGRRATRGFDRGTIVRIGIVAAACVAAWYAVEAFGRPYEFFDMKIYHGAAVWWAGGGDLYTYVAPNTTLGYTYPPFAALLMLPMAAVPMLTAGFINIGLSIAALMFVLVVLLKPLADRQGWPLWFVVGLALPLATAIEPVRESLGYGQVNVLLFALIIADLLGLRLRGRAPAYPAAGIGRLRMFIMNGGWAGMGIGLATSIKLTPALFIVYLLISRQWRPFWTAIGTTVGVTLVGFVLARPESVAYFTSVMWQTNRVGQADMTPNQSLAGVLARLYDTFQTPMLLWITFAFFILAVGLSRAAAAHAEGDELTAFALIGLTANVISPISWSHHLVFVIPAVVVLIDAALRRRAASRGMVARGPGFSIGRTRLREPLWFPAWVGLRHMIAAVGFYALFLISPIWPYEHQLPAHSHYQDGLIGVLAENSLALALIALVAALPWRPGAEPAFAAETAAVPAARRSASERAHQVLTLR
ncbi:hypothetical protein F4553_004346 [Allocatelliglobosispora scoriae]|uniref:DUF2029 domain-containing protein n=1 Tax=Allocatelliglobosispora scoriae TaxID=643052 RepID=A0A841BPG5_9ACTN|nr:glycosyltransferase 87 family protein [Allocatelliglobosispora scoriae]MBB5870967.1 hypothetical protein [Allocatelliglobosispora scoriae]